MFLDNFDTSAFCTFLEVHLGGHFNFLYNTASKPFEGGEYAIFALADAAQCRRIAVRVPRAPPGPLTSIRVQSEVDIRRRIDAARVDRFQPLLMWDSTADNDLRHPFIIVSWAEGYSLRWSENVPVLEAYRQGVLRTIADTSLDLLRIHESGVSALQWITSKIDRKIARATANNLPYGTVSECERQKSLIRKYWIPDLDDAPHVLVHGDLSGNNIIVDEDFNVTSFIDLGWAELVPLQFAAEYPRILVHEPVEDQSGFSWTQKDFTQLQKDRDYYLQYIKERASREGGLALSYWLVLSRKDEVSRYWWYTAASRADAHKFMSLCDWDPVSAIERGGKKSSVGTVTSICDQSGI